MTNPHWITAHWDELIMASVPTIERMRDKLRRNIHADFGEDYCQEHPEVLVASRKAAAIALTRDETAVLFHTIR